MKVFYPVYHQVLRYSRMPCWSLQHQEENGSLREPKLLKKIHGHTKALRAHITTVGKLVRKTVLF